MGILYTVFVTSPGGVQDPCPDAILQPGDDGSSSRAQRSDARTEDGDGDPVQPAVTDEPGLLSEVSRSWRRPMEALHLNKYKININ